MIRLPPTSTRTDTLFPYTTLFRSPSVVVGTPVNWPRKEPMAVRLAPTMTISFMGLLHWGVGGGHRDFVGNVLKPPTRPDCCVARCSESSCTRTYTAVRALRAPCTRSARYGFKWLERKTAV